MWYYNTISNEQLECFGVFLKPYPHLYSNAKRMQKRIMWTCRWAAFAFIRLCSVQANAICLESVLQRKIRSQSYWCGHTLIRAANNNQRNACSFAYAANAEQATFWYLFAFALVPHALFAFAYRCGRAFRNKRVVLHCSFFSGRFFLSFSTFLLLIWHAHRSFTSKSCVTF